VNDMRARMCVCVCVCVCVYVNVAETSRRDWSTDRNQRFFGTTLEKCARRPTSSADDVYPSVACRIARGDGGWREKRADGSPHSTHPS